VDDDPKRQGNFTSSAEGLAYDYGLIVVNIMHHIVPVNEKQWFRT
jgi:hypothetical protein